jgi:PAS domain S-box-containing protein
LSEGQKEAEEGLRGSEERLRQLIEYAPEGIFLFDSLGGFIDVNREAELVTGYKKEELVGKSFLTVGLLPKKYLQKFMEVLEKSRSGQKTGPFELELTRKDGSTITVEISTFPIESQGKVEVIGTARDITERKAIEEKLRESEERFRDLYESIQEPVAIYVGREGRLIDYNTAFKKLTGYTDEELKGKTFLDLTHPDDRAMVMEKYRTDYSEDKLPLVYEVRGVNKKGETDYLEVSVSAYKKKGRVIGVEAINRVITERKKMQEKLKESEERFRNLYESVPDALAVYVGREGHLIDYNTAFKRSFGYTDEELKDKIFLDFVHPDYHAMLIEEYRTEHPEEKLPFRCEITQMNKKGEIIPTEISVGPYKKKGRIIGINVMHRDITERKEMQNKLQEYAEHLEEMVEQRTKELKESQERLIKSERMAAIGQLATMVGHDIRNPLTGIQNAAYFLKMKMEASKDEKVKKMFEVIDKEVNHANNIVRDLLDYSRVRKPELKKLDLASSIQDALAQVKFSENITLTTKFREAPTIEADPEQLRRIFQNIALNGAQAMPNGGELTVLTRKNGDFVEVVFTDTGGGILEENMSKLFAPLFTTKTEGVGLGLAICKNLVEGHNGRLEVNSKVGEGSTFTIKLPIHQTKEGEKQI